MLTLPFLDYFHIDYKSINLNILCEKPVIEKIVFNSDSLSTYYSIFKNENDIKLFYRHQTNSNHHQTIYSMETTNMATYDFNKKEFINNKILFKKPGISHNYCVFNKKHNNKLLAIGGLYSQILTQNNTVNLYSSDNGEKWSFERKIFNMSDSLPQNYSTCYDSQNILLYDEYEEEFLVYMRHNVKLNTRHAQFSKSNDLINWSKFKNCIFKKFSEYIYTSNVIQYPNSFIFLSLTNVKCDGQCKPKSLLSYSYDGQHFNTINENLIDTEFEYRTVPFIHKIDNSFYIYVDFFNENKLISYKLRKDGFASLNTTQLDTEEYIIYKSLLLLDSDIRLNFETSGYIQIILYNEKNKIINESEKITGDYIDLLIKWKNNFTENSLKENVKIKILMKNAKLYSITLNVEFKPIKNLLTSKTQS